MSASMSTMDTPAGPFTAIVDGDGAVLGSGWTAEPADLLVNCTSVGLADPLRTFKDLPVRADALGVYACVVDMVYRDGGTRLLEAARTRGADVIDGLEILIAQGAASFERWTGQAAPRQAMREAAGAIATT